MNRQTIYALSSGGVPSAVAIVRVSGPHVKTIVEALCGRLPAPRQAVFWAIKHPHSGDLIDKAIVLFFRGPHSFTGEDMVEFQLHGGRAVIGALMTALQCFDDVLMAERGEFSRRSFENGKLDLLEIEGLSDLIRAETEGQRVQALMQAGGRLSAHYETWRSGLITAIGLVESALDFSDEGDVGSDVFVKSLNIATGLQSEIKAHLDDRHRGEILRDGFRVVIAGPPNAGKSSLMNQLARRDVAIVSSEGGTTRDVISVRLDVCGVPVIVSDTAGIREAVSAVEREGIRRSFSEVFASELVIWLIDGAGDKSLWQCPSEFAALEVPVLKVMNKIDIAADSGREQGGADQGTLTGDQFDFALSALLGDGVDGLVGAIGDAVNERVGGGAELSVTRVRHRDLLRVVVEALDDFKASDPGEVELRAEDLRRAANALGRITGKFDVEDVLDFIFGEFCIGK